MAIKNDYPLLTDCNVGKNKYPLLTECGLLWTPHGSGRYFFRYQFTDSKILPMILELKALKKQYDRETKLRLASKRKKSPQRK